MLRMALTSRNFRAFVKFAGVDLVHARQFCELNVVPEMVIFIGDRGGRGPAERGKKSGTLEVSRWADSPAALRAM